MKPRWVRTRGLLLSAKHEGAAVSAGQEMYVIGGKKDRNFLRAVTGDHEGLAISASPPPMLVRRILEKIGLV